MADTTEGDANVLDLDLLAPALIFLIAGLLIHSFIIGVNVSDWWRGRSVTPVDHIVTALGISRIICQCASTTTIFVSIFFPVTLVIINVFYHFIFLTNFWLTSLLSIVLCLKISNLHARLFLYLRRMILHRTGHLIVASVLLSALHSLMNILVVVISGETYNTTTHGPYRNCQNIYSMYIIPIGTFIPILLYSISSVLLFFSLYHHTTRMKMSSNLSINLETYYSVMKLVSFTFIYNTIYCFGHFLSVFYYLYFCVKLTWIHVGGGFFPVLHSTYLIYRTTRLRNQMSKVLHNVMDFLLQKKVEGV